MAELQARAESDPGLLDDLDSIRSTVALLRSVEPAKAPRSFALAEAPVQVRVRRSRMAMAPAVFAIAAAAAVGLLAVGNLTDVVRQSDSTSEDSNRTALQASDESLPQGAITGGEFESALVSPSLEAGDAVVGALVLEVNELDRGPERRGQGGLGVRVMLGHRLAPQPTLRLEPLK